MSVLFPNVPLVAGVPAVLRRANDLANAQQALASASRDLPGTQRWGIYKTDGTSAIEVSSVLSVEHSAEYRISDYPVEGGQFESYDKVAVPFDIRVAATREGSVDVRGQFLIEAQALLESFEVFDVVTPERVYLNVNAVRIIRTANSDRGAGLATVEFGLREVRAAAKAQYSKVDGAEPLAAELPVSAAEGTSKSATAIRKQNQGSVQAKPATVTATTKSAGKISVAQEATLKYAKPVVLGTRSGAALVKTAGGKAVYQYPVGKR